MAKNPVLRSFARHGLKPLAFWLLAAPGLRAVDGGWAVPYWDSTIEMADVAEGRIASPFDTVLSTRRAGRRTIQSP